MGFVERLERASAALAEGTLTEAPAAEVERMLAAELPELLACIARDRSAGAFARWGLSTVIDENLAGPVIGRALFDVLHEAAGVVALWPVGNAGVLHVYGYLLSTTTTPYGLKRERWLGSELTQALGMPEGTFIEVLTGPGRNAIDGSRAATNEAASVGADADPGLAGFVADCVLTRLDSAAVVVDEFAGEEREEVFQALYFHREADGTSDGGAVAYVEMLGDSRRLVTVFPTAAGAEEWLVAFTAEPPRLRYNAAAHELAPRAPLVSRRVMREG